MRCLALLFLLFMIHSSVAENGIREMNWIKWNGLMNKMDLSYSNSRTCCDVNCVIFKVIHKTILGSTVLIHKILQFWAVHFSRSSFKHLTPPIHPSITP
jgi:hypothetical protein